MTYTPNDFQPGDILTASHLNAMNKEIQNQNIDIILSKAGHSILQIQIHGVEPGRKYKLAFFRRVKSDRHWIQIDSEYGYGKIAGTRTKNKEELEGSYGPLPIWMPNNGYVESSISFEPTATSHIIEIDMSQWAIPLIKPILDSAGDGEFYDGAKIGLIGLSTSRPYQKLAFSVALYDELNQQQGAMSQPFYLGVTVGKNGTIIDTEMIKIRQLRLSI